MKQKHWKVSVFDKTSETIRDDTFYTTDTEAYLVFELTDEDFTPDSAMVTVYNIYGKATIHASAEVADGIVRYKMPVDAIGHPGGWRTQVIYTKDNEDYTTTIIEFDIGGHLLGNKKPSIVVIENWNSFMKHAEGLVKDWEQLEEIRQTNEQQRELAESARQTTFETNESTRQSEFETNEASRQTSELVREEAENNRQSTFEENEVGRQSEFEENEQGRESAESVRVANEEERISKDSERDSKIDGKANKSMLLNPKYDLVYDSCVRNVDTPLDAYSVPMESGHYFENAEDRDSDTTLTYEPDGVLLARPSARRDFSPVLIAGFDVDFPYFDVRAKELHVANDSRFWFIKYKDKDNWVGISVHGAYQEIRVIATVEGIQTDIAVEVTGGSGGELQASPDTIYSLKAEINGVHNNFAETSRALRVFKNKQWVFTVPIPTNAVDFPSRVGFSVGSRTEILSFKAGRSS